MSQATRIHARAITFWLAVPLFVGGWLAIVFGSQDYLAWLVSPAVVGAFAITLVAGVVLGRKGFLRPRQVVAAAIGGAITFGLSLLVVSVMVLVIWFRPGGAPVPTRFAASGISFDLPPTWHVDPSALQLHYETVLAFVGTGDGSLTCASDYVPGQGGTCTEHHTLPANSIVVKVSAWDGPPTPVGPVAFVLSGDAGASPVTVGAAQAAFETLDPGSPGSSGSEAVLKWTIARPGVPEGAYTLVAYLEGPDMSEARGELEGLIQSITLGP
jgi:hypothetical protein